MLAVLAAASLRGRSTSHILMERSELIERLVPLIPPPRAHQVRYHGILVPITAKSHRSKWHW